MNKISYRGREVELKVGDVFIGYKYGTDDTLQIEPAKLENITSRHFMFVVKSGSEIMVKRDEIEQESSTADCFYSSKNAWNVALNDFGLLEDLLYK